MAGNELSFSIKGDKETVKALNKLGSNLPAALESTMQQIMFFLQATIQREKLSGSPLKVRTGRLRSSITNLVQRVGNVIIGIVGTNVRYGAIHEFGGVIRPKSSKYLAIPLDAAKTPSGVARGGPRSFQNTFVRKTQAGNLIIFGKPNPGAKEAEPLFILKKFVRIPARPYMRPALEENAENIRQLFRNTLVRMAEQLRVT